MVRIKLDTKELVEYEKKLGKFINKGFPYIVRGTLNNVAFKGREIARTKVLPSKFTFRNKFTQNSIIVTKVPKEIKDPERMYSELGAVEQLSGKGIKQKGGKAGGYMRAQEHGKVETKNGKHGVPIPTGDAAGAPGQVPIPRLPKRGNYLRNIRLNSSQPNTGNKWGDVRAKVAQAKKARKRFVFLDIGRGKGIYRITQRDSRRKIRGRIRKVTKLRLIWDFGKPQIRIKSTKWLDQTKTLAVRHIGDIYGEQLKRQLRYYKIVY